MAQHAPTRKRNWSRSSRRGCRRRPTTSKGWTLLARSYMALGQYAEGAEAYASWKRTPKPDNELKLEYAEAQVLTDRRRARAARLVRCSRSCCLRSPTTRKHCGTAGSSALELGREDLVRARWGRAARDRVRRTRSRRCVRTQLAALGAAPQLVPRPQRGAGQRGPGRAAGDGRSEYQAQRELGSGRSVGGFGTERHAVHLRARARRRSAGCGDPQPASAVPGEFTLSDANSMIPGRSLADFDELTLVARLSASGQPTEQPGDW